MRYPIYNITPFTLLDYPNRTACIIWFAGCNMRCLYCYNPDIVLGKGNLSIDDTIRFLKSRQSLLQAVVFSGGECTMHPAIKELAQTAKKMGYLVKIDTNGSLPLVLENLVDNKLVDYIALDFKATAQRHQYITRSKGWHTFFDSLSIIQQAKIPFEVRTTWHSNLLSYGDLETMVGLLEENCYTGQYYVQRYVNHVPTLKELPYGQQELDTARLSTSNIQVVLR